MKHLDVFSGIGGFSLAAQNVWGSEYENIGFVEIDPYCQAILRMRFKEAKIYGDIRKIKAENFVTHPNECGLQEQGSKLETNRVRQLLQVDLLTGGFPCQPFSTCGKRRGKEDNRYLWDELYRLIQETKPTWFIGENVVGIITMALDQVLSDLENEGYTTQAFVIPACSVNAPHRRDRVWIIGYSQSKRYTENGEICEGSSSDTIRTGTDVTDSKSGESRKPTQQKRGEDISGGNIQTPTNSNIRGIRRHERESLAEGSTPCGSWSENWIEVATRLCGVDDGLPAKVDRLELSKSKHRVERLKALGNSIVPQVAIELMQAIKLSEVNTLPIPPAPKEAGILGTFL